MSTKIKTFDVAEFLQDEETMAEYLNMALADPNPDMLRLATDNIVRALGAKKRKR
jgi:DNA-binding phage protein